MNKRIFDRYGGEFESFCLALCDEQYLTFFDNPQAKYVVDEENLQPYYTDIPKAFFNLFSSHYNDIYVIAGLEERPLKDELDVAYDEYRDNLGAICTALISELYEVKIVAILAVIFDADLLNTGFMEHCGKQGLISDLLHRLKHILEKNV